MGKKYFSTSYFHNINGNVFENKHTPVLFENEHTPVPFGGGVN